MPFVGPLEAWQWRASYMSKAAYATFLEVGFNHRFDRNYDGNARLAHKTLGEGEALFSKPNVDSFGFA